MPHIKHILFPVDFSDRSKGAAPFVAEMARQYEAKVTMISVAHLNYAGLAEAPMIDPQVILDGVKSQLDAAFLSDLAGVKVDRTAVLGDPAQVIIDFVATGGVDMVMMPTHGYSPFRQLLLGSVTAKVLHDVNVPVWTMAHTAAAPGSAHFNVRKIVCAVDGSAASIELMRWAGGLCKNLGADLRLVHAVPSMEAQPECQIDQVFQEEWRENARRSIQKLEAAADIEVPVCVGVGTVPDVVRNEALQHSADLVLIGRGALQQTLGRLRTHSYGIIRNAPCPVLSV